jgi:hypothetical protein
MQGKLEEGQADLYRWKRLSESYKAESASDTAKAHVLDLEKLV